MATKHGLGRGFDSLIRDGTEKQKTVSMVPPLPADGIKPQRIALDKIRKNSFQPRKTFKDEALAELTASIKEKGIISPLIVRTSGGGTYELIAGERRLRAAKAAGLKDVPVVIRDATDRDSLELALIENLQREDLNPIEEAQAYNELAIQFGMTQEEIADRVGKARASVANTMRLLSLPAEVLKLVQSGELSAGMAKALLGLEIKEEQVLYARRACSEGMTVRQIEKLIQKIKQAPRKQRAFRTDIPREHLTYILDKLHTHLGTSVRVTPCRTFANGKKGKGIIEIDFFSNDELDRILSILGVSMD